MINSKELKKRIFKSGKPYQSIVETFAKNSFLEISKKVSLPGKYIVVLCGSNNNGGYGMALVRHLRDETKTNAILIGDRKKLDEDLKINYLKILGNVKEDFSIISKADIIIDAMIGCDINSISKDEIKLIINKVNLSKAYRVSIDVPSGLNPDIIEPSNGYINADLILTILDTKQALENFKEKTIVINIGI